MHDLLLFYPILTNFEVDVVGIVIFIVNRQFLLLLLVGLSQKKVAAEFGDILLKASHHFLNEKGSLICELVF